MKLYYNNIAYIVVHDGRPTIIVYILRRLWCVVYMVIFGGNCGSFKYITRFFFFFILFPVLSQRPSAYFNGYVYTYSRTCVYSNSLTPQSRQRDYVMANPRNPQAISALDTISSHEGNYYYYYVGMAEICRVACPVYIIILCINIVLIVFKNGKNENNVFAM